MSLSSEQREQIGRYLENGAWDHILETILTEEQRNNPKKMADIALEMEDILKGVAANFGLCAMDVDPVEDEVETRRFGIPGTVEIRRTL